MTDAPTPAPAPAPAPAPGPRRAPAIGFVVATIFIDTIGFGIVIPVIPELIMRLGHGDVADAARIGGWLALVYAAMQFVFGPVMGNLGDRFGRRPVLLASLAAFGLDYLLTAFAPTLVWLFVGRIFAGICGASYGPATAALADLSAPEDRARVFGYVGAAFGLGFIVGPAIGGLLGELSPRAPFIAAAALAAVNFAYGWFVLPETLPVERRRRFEWKRANPVGALITMARLPGVLTLAAVFFWWSIASLVYPSIWAFYGIAAFGWSTGMIGLSLAWFGIGIALVQTFAIGRIVARIGERRAALVGMGFGLAGFVGFLFADQSWMAFAILAAISFEGLAHPALSALISRSVSDDQQGEVQGFMGSIAAVASLPAPLLFNWPLAHFTGAGAAVQFPGAPFAVATALAVVAIGLLWRAQTTASPAT